MQAQAQVEQLHQQIQQVDWTRGVNYRDPAVALCPSCHQSTGGGKFCQACGTSLMAARFCGNCGTALNPTAAFCSECGTPSV